MKINLKEMTTNDLKALAYDLIVQQQITNGNLQLVNQEIEVRASQQPAPNNEETQ